MEDGQLQQVQVVQVGGLQVVLGDRIGGRVGHVVVVAGVERLAAGEAWAGDKPGTGHVWTDELGHVMRPDILSARFEQAQRGLGLEPLVLHGMRHTSASVAFAAGVPINVVSARLGHADIKVTLSIYTHMLDTQRTEAKLLGAALYGSPATSAAGGS